MIERINLNYDWKYCEKYTEESNQIDFDEKDYVSVDIPHTNKVVPFNDFDESIYQFISSYRKHVFIDKKLEGKRLILEFEAVANAADVYINGEYAFSHKGSYTAFSADITKFVKFGKDNLISVKVDSTEREDIPPFGNIVDYLVYGGIYREVYIYVRDNDYIKNMRLTPLDVLTAPKIEVELTFDKVVANKDLDIEIFFENKQIIKKIIVANGSDKYDYIFDIPDAKLWDIDNPNLYIVKVTLGKDVIEDRVGLREIKFKRNGFFLNGNKVMIRGLNRHQSYPYVGNAMPASAQIADADFLKKHLGVNLVRTSHYPNSKHFLNRCDEIGLLVFTEIPGWQFVSKDEEWRKVCLQHVEEMVSQNYNHPSIILWGVRINESQDDDELYTKTNEIAHNLDTTRPTTGVRFIMKSHLLEDVYAYNDFSHSGNKMKIVPKFMVTSLFKPLIISEHNGHMFPTKVYDHEQKRLEHALRHARVVNAAYKSKGHSGVIGWCMSDYNTHRDFGSGDRICYHGVSDMFRIDKLAAYVYSSQQDKIPVLEISSNMEIGDSAGGHVGAVYMFTNCDEVKLYKNGIHINTFDMKMEREKSEFKHLPYPPVILEDIIGDQIEKQMQYKFSKKDAKRVKKALLDIKRYSPLGAALRNPFSLIKVMTVYKLNMGDMTELYGKYVTSWGGKQCSYKFEGYKNGEKVCEVEKGAFNSTYLDAVADSDTLVEGDTYDVTRIVVKALSNYKNVLPYDYSVIKIQTNDVVEVLGPKEVALMGGQIAFWVRTKGKEGKAKVKITNDKLGTKEIYLDVKKI